MTEMSPEANAAAESAALAVEHAQEEQETREAAAAALDNSETAAIVSGIAAENAAEALDNADEAGATATIAAGVATGAADTATAAGQVAQQAKSEVAELREELLGRLDDIKTSITSTETPNTVVEVGTEHLHGSDSKESNPAGKEDANAGSGESDGTGTDSPAKETSGKAKKRGFNRGRR